MVELQQNLSSLEANNIVPFAISPDPPELLAAFARKYDIQYPLLSDRDSAVIRAFGILNSDIDPGHKHYGLPRPGTYLVDEQGLVFDKSFFVSHRERESVNDMLQEGFRVEASEGGAEAVLETAELTARLYFSAASVRREQRIVLTADIRLKEGMHVYGRPLSDGYIPVSLVLDEVEDLKLIEVEYSDPELLHFAACLMLKEESPGDFDRRLGPRHALHHLEGPPAQVELAGKQPHAG